MTPGIDDGLEVFSPTPLEDLAALLNSVLQGAVSFWVDMPWRQEARPDRNSKTDRGLAMPRWLIYYWHHFNKV